MATIFLLPCNGVMMPLFDTMYAEDHEQVVFCADRAAGLTAIIAIHDTTLGPSLGGIRMRAYASEAEAVTDALRLAQAMTFKAAVAGLDYGGGKGVVIGDHTTTQREMLFRALGRAVESLGGRYIPTEDMGTTTADIERVRKESRFGVGRDEVFGGGGDPSPPSGRGGPPPRRYRTGTQRKPLRGRPRRGLRRWRRSIAYDRLGNFLWLACLSGGS